MQEVLKEAGIEVTPENKRNVDMAVHEIVNVEYKNCPPTWKEVKNRTRGSDSDRKAFIRELRRAMKER